MKWKKDIFYAMQFKVMASDRMERIEIEWDKSLAFKTEKSIRFLFFLFLNYFLSFVLQITLLIQQRRWLDRRQPNGVNRWRPSRTLMISINSWNRRKFMSNHFMPTIYFTNRRNSIQVLVGLFSSFSYKLLSIGIISDFSMIAHRHWNCEWTKLCGTGTVLGEQLTHILICKCTIIIFVQVNWIIWIINIINCKVNECISQLKTVNLSQDDCTTLRRTYSDPMRNVPHCYEVNSSDESDAFIHKSIRADAIVRHAKTNDGNECIPYVVTLLCVLHCTSRALVNGI